MDLHFDASYFLLNVSRHLDLILIHTLIVLLSYLPWGYVF